MSEMLTSEKMQSRLEKLTALRGLATALTGEGGETKSTWRRMLLGRLAALLLDEKAKLTGAELRSMLETIAEGKDSEASKGAGERLPAEFENIVQEIYGVNLQRDVKGAAETAEDG